MLSQIDKDSTEIYRILKEFIPYIYGRKFTLITHQKPLMSIFSTNKPLPNMAETNFSTLLIFNLDSITI